MAEYTTLKIRTEVAERFREFCAARSLQIGAFAESVLLEALEDTVLAEKANEALVQSVGRPVYSHADLLEKLGHEPSE